MQPPENDPSQNEIEAIDTDEERQALADPIVPDDVKAEIMERLERFKESDLDQERSDNMP